MRRYEALGRSKYEYRRRLPHYQTASGALFITFRTFARMVLPEPARDLALQHCLHDHGSRIQLSAAVVMPTHIHLLFWALKDQAGWPYPLIDIMQSLKGSSAHTLNRMLQRSGPVWDEESFDHVLRSDESWEEKREYIRQNPVRAGLARRPEEYRWLWLSPLT
jgi:REP element-mobilizing transposase RayT